MAGNVPEFVRLVPCCSVFLYIFNKLYHFGLCASRRLLVEKARNTIM